MTPADLARALSLPDAAAARRLLLREALCPFVRIGRSIYIRRDAFLAALHRLESIPMPRRASAEATGAVEARHGSSMRPEAQR